MEECEVFRSLIDDKFEESIEDFFICVPERKRIQKMSQLVRQIKEILGNEQQINTERGRREVTYIKLYLARKIARVL